MAQKKSKVYIGFEDEIITEKHKLSVNFTTNKIGGKPDWINTSVTKNPECQLCRLTMPLVVQVYAPLEKSLYHRTLYLFGCVNPNCWNQNGSWVCLRSQLLDKKTAELETTQNTMENYDWCDGANVWEDEENGNVCENMSVDMVTENTEQLNNMVAAMDLENGDEVVPSVGATGNLCSPLATAEIEGEEDEVVTVETPVLAETDIAVLLDQAKPVPQVPSHTLEFASYFISVGDEDESNKSSPDNAEGMQQCKAYDKESNSLLDERPLANTVADRGELPEKYEKSRPAHGDKLFHTFITKIQKNPGQILRYIREGGSPLLLYLEGDLPKRCQHCHGDLVFELQLLPTLISCLQLVDSGSGHLEFGTVLVLACQRSCWDSQDMIRSEYVIVQREL